MSRLPILLLFLLLIPATIQCEAESSNNEPETNITFIKTTPDQQALFSVQDDDLLNNSYAPRYLINIDQSVTYQEIYGFGFALTGGSAMHINNMNASDRSALLNELFGTADGQIGMSYIRVSLGASDLDPAPFTYNDLPLGQVDINQDNFSIDPDRDHLIPVLKEILAINPEVNIMASPWSAPSWMKSNGSTVGGSLLTQYYDSYATYFVKYIQAMEAEGITITSVTPQNEPLHGGNNPSMVMTASAQSAFIGQSLGPAFEANNIDTKIIVYDHNADNTDYPMQVMANVTAGPYTAGSAFHLYGGVIGNLSTVHNSYPNKELYFTEQWYSGNGTFNGDLQWHTREIFIGGTRNWCNAVIEWNLASDSNWDPHTPGGCTLCKGALTIDGNNVLRNAGYYVLAHASKYVRPGSFRIQSNYENDIPNVAFLTPDNKIVLHAMNNTGETQDFLVKSGDMEFKSRLESGAVATYVWDAQ